MSTTTSQTNTGPPASRWFPLALVTAFLGTSLLVWLALWATSLLQPDVPAPGNPLTVLAGLALGTQPWPGSLAGIMVAACAAVLILPLGGWLLLRWRRRAQSTRVDDRTGVLASRDDLAPYLPEGVAASARRLRPNGVSDDPSDHGVLIGEILPSKTTMRASWEDTEVDIWGPRTGKTTARAVPSIIEAPGPVLATSNKRDLHDATRGVREHAGRIWAFDPQGILGDGEPEFWFDPLERVNGPRQAAELVSHFVAGTRSADAKTDAYFDGEGENLMGYFFLAAARSGQPITAAYRWAADSRESEPRNILQASGDTLLADKLQTILDTPDKQRAGVYASALKLLSCLEEPTVARWVTPPKQDDPRPKFNPADFLTSKDTLYLLSMEGSGSAGPLVAALTFDVLETGKELARTQPGARLDPPLVSVLDEAANVVRIRELPNLYSHFGSRGLLVQTILQSWAQGEEVWGKNGMQKLWDAANIRVYGGGVADAEVLGRLSKLIGEQDKISWSASYDPQRPTTHSRSTQPRDILNTADLAALPRGRAVVLASGAPAVLIRPIPWMQSARAAEVRLSLARYDPGHIEEHR